MLHTDRVSPIRRVSRALLLFVAAAALTSTATRAGDLPPQEKPGCPPTNGPSRKDRRASDPVQLSTLRYVEDVTDLVVPSPAGELRFSRHYRSHEETSAGAAWHPLGGNWRHSFEAVAVPHFDAQSTSIGSIELAARDGRVDLYLPIAVSPVGGCPPTMRAYFAASGIDEVLEATFWPVEDCAEGCGSARGSSPEPVGSDWRGLPINPNDPMHPVPIPQPPVGCGSVLQLGMIRELAADGAYTEYRLTPSGWKPRQSYDTNGNRIDWLYQLDGRLDRVQADSACWLQFHYAQSGPAFAEGSLVAVEASTGQWVTFEHYEEGDQTGNPGDLKSVTRFGLASDAPRSWTYTYSKRSSHPPQQYETDSLLLTATDPRGHVAVTNIYGTHDLVNRQLRYDTGLYDYFHGAGEYAVWSINRDGQVREMDFSQTNSPGGVPNPRMRLEKEFAGRVPPENRPNCWTSLVNPPPPGECSVDPTRPGSTPRVSEYQYYADAGSGWETHPAAAEMMISRITMPDGSSEQRFYNFQRNANGQPPAEYQTNELLKRFYFSGLWKVVRTGLPTNGTTPVLTDEYDYDLVVPGSAGPAGCSCRAALPKWHKDPEGRQTDFEYDDRGNVTRIQHPDLACIGGGRIEENFEYDAIGRLIKHSYGSSHVDMYFYEPWSFGSPPVQVQPSRPTTVWRGVYQGANGDTPTLVERYQYDLAGNLIRVIDGKGRDTVFEYNGFNELVHVASRPLAGGQRIHRWLTYDAMGNLVRVDAENRDESGALVAANPIFTSIFDYDQANRRVREAVELAPTDVSPAALDTGAIADITRFAVTEFEYNAEDLLVKIKSPAAVSGQQPNNTVTFKYDEWDQLFRVIRGEEGGAGVVSQYNYDPVGNLTEVIEALGTPMERTTVTTYDGLGRAVRTTSPDATVIEHTYDGADNRISTKITGFDGTSPTPKVLAFGRFPHDELGRLTATEWSLFDPAGGPQSTSPVVRTSFQYDVTGALLYVTKPDGHITGFWRDQADRLYRRYPAYGLKPDYVEFTYDENSNPKQALSYEYSEIAGDPVRVAKSQFDFDNLDRLTQTRRYTGTSTFAATAFAYDSRGNLVRSIDPRGKITRHVYDPLSRLTETGFQMDASGFGGGTEIITRQTWDIASRLTAQTDDNGNVTRYAYDDLNRLYCVRLADGTLLQVGYDAVWADGAAAPSNPGQPGFDPFGNPTIVSTGKPPAPGIPGLGGRVRLDNTYDILGRLTWRHISYLDDANHTADDRFAYDALGRLLRAWTKDPTLGTSSMVERRYDTLSRLTSDGVDFAPLDYPQYHNGVATSVHYTYDDAGNIRQVVYPGGRVVKWDVDALNRVAGIKEPSATLGQPDRVLATFQWAGPGRLVRRTAGNGIVTEYAYNGLLKVASNGDLLGLVPGVDPDAPDPDDQGFGRLHTVRHSHGVPSGNGTLAPNPIAAIDNWRLTWDAANNKTRRRQDSFGEVMTAGYGYDALNRLLTAGVNVGDPSDPDSKDPRFRDPSTPETYHLDGVHNRISVDSGAAPGSYTMLDGCGVSPSAGGCDRAMNRPTRSPIAQYLYDGRGNTAQEESSCIGDATGDHQVTTQDLSGVIARFGQAVSAVNADYDLNNDGVINTGDLTLVLVNFGKACDWTELRYDWADRLIETKASSWGGAVAGTLTSPVKVEVHKYQYDALGRRTARTLWAAGSYGSGIPTAPKCTRMIYGGVGTTADAAVGWQLLEEQDGTGRTLATFVPSGGGRYIDEVVCYKRDLAASGLTPASAATAPPCNPEEETPLPSFAEFYLHTDDLFSTTSVTDSTGAVVERYDYHDYGFPLILDADGQTVETNAQGLYASAVGNPFLFTGREWDAESRLYHYRTRAYHPGLGRFLQIDSIGVWGDSSNFGNASAGFSCTPLSRLDPDGTEGTCPLDTEDWDWHHLFPQNHRDEFTDIGIDIDSWEWGWHLRRADHIALNNSWRAQWDAVFDGLKQRNTKATVQFIREQLERIMENHSHILGKGFAVDEGVTFAAWEAQAGKWAVKTAMVSSGFSRTMAVVGKLGKVITKVSAPILAIILVYGICDSMARGASFGQALFDNAVIDSQTVKDVVAGSRDAYNQWVDEGAANVRQSRIDSAVPQGRARKEDRELRRLLDDGMKPEPKSPKDDR